MLPSNDFCLKLVSSMKLMSLMLSSDNKLNKMPSSIGLLLLNFWLSRLVSVLCNFRRRHDYSDFERISEMLLPNIPRSLPIARWFIFLDIFTFFILVSLKIFAIISSNERMKVFDIRIYLICIGHVTKKYLPF